MSPHALMKNPRDATSNSGAHIPTNSKLCMAGGPGVITSGEHAVTTAEGVSMDSEEGTISNKPTMCENVLERIKAEEEATATTETTKKADSSAQIGIIKREGASAAANQGLTKGESNVTANDIFANITDRWPLPNFL